MNLPNLTTRVLECLLPAQCTLCGGASAGERLCPGCRQELPVIQDPCRRCALPGLPAGQRLCKDCLRCAPAWHQACAGLVYDYPADRLVRRFKFRHKLVCGRILAEAMAAAACCQVSAAATGASNGAALGLAPEVLVPVPLHFTRQWRRGFNPSEFLAVHFGAALSWPVHTKLLFRHRATPAQSGLERAERQRNLRGAFHCRQTSYRHVGLVDDVLTTGATLEECALTLKAAGAERVSVWVAARVP